jgi:hypothetical protein
MDKQASYRSFDIEYSDGSTMQVEIGFTFATGDVESIANQQLENFTLTSALDPMEMLSRALLSEINETEDDETEDDDSELQLEEAA